MELEKYMNENHMGEIFNAAPQAVGFIALLIALTGLLQKDKSTLMLFSAAAAGTYSIQFMLLGSIQTAFIFMMMVARILYARRYPKSHGGFVFFTFLGSGVSLYIMDAVTDLLPLMAFILVNIAYFYFDKAPMRICFVLANTALIINALILGSIGNMIGESIALIINTLALINHVCFDGKRHDKDVISIKVD